MVKKNDDDTIARKIEALKRLTEENTQMLKKAGLYGLSSVGVGLSVGQPQKNVSPNYLNCACRKVQSTWIV